ncbi:MAG: T9SS type A sorting domain-containing protein, partial [Bacteroidota bacterium]
YQVITYCAFGEYSPWSEVQLIEPNNGRSASNVEEELDLDLAEEQEVREEEIILFPNPVVNELNLITNFESEKVLVRIQDQSGRAVYEGRFQNEFNAIQIPTDQLSPGTYFISVTDEKEVKSKLFIKQ